MRISKEKPGIPRMKGFSRFVDTRLMNALSKRVLHFASELYIPKRHGCNGRSVERLYGFTSISSKVKRKKQAV